jgi:hypothetical protein
VGIIELHIGKISGLADAVALILTAQTPKFLAMHTFLQLKIQNVPSHDLILSLALLFVITYLQNLSPH